MTVEECVGDDETYLLCQTDGFEIFIYDDGFDVQRVKVDERFEADDIPNLEFAQKKLISIIFGPNRRSS